MRCDECGAYVSEEDAFCGECGRPIAGLAPSAEPESLPEPPEQPDDRLLLTPPPGPPAATSPPGKKKALPLVPVLVLVGIVLFLICLSAAGLFFWLAYSGRSEPTGVAVIRTPLYQDDFGDAGSGWDVYDEDDTWAGYWEGEYRLAVNQDSYMAWANPDFQDMPADFEVEVEARQVEGPLDNNFGLLVRYDPASDDFYWFQISGDGYYSVDLRRGENWVTVVEWEESDAINQGLDATNHVKVTGSGSRFDFYVNDTYLTDVFDDTLLSGTIGLAVGTFDEPGVVVHFDNIRVFALQE
jgi:hypothetical protein